MLEAAGLTYDDLATVDYVSYSDGVSLMQDGNADVFTLGTTVPASAIMDLANSADITLVRVEGELIAKMKEHQPGLSRR